MAPFNGLAPLKLFNVSGNQLTGIVPWSLTGLTSLSYVALGNNLLQGPTPSFKAKGIGPPPSFKGKGITLDMTGLNSFCLDVPGAPCDPRVNALLSIVGEFGYPVVFAESWKGNDPCNSSTKWVGITCSRVDITVINFTDMGLTGIISPSFARLKALKVINLSHNNLTGFVPEEFTELNNLKTLDVSYNHQLYGFPDLKPNVLHARGGPDVGKHVPRPAPSSLGSPSRNNAGKIVASVIGGTVLVLLLIGFV